MRSFFSFSSVQNYPPEELNCCSSKWPNWRLRKKEQQDDPGHYKDSLIGHLYIPAQQLSEGPKNIFGALTTYLASILKARHRHCIYSTIEFRNEIILLLYWKADIDIVFSKQLNLEIRKEAFFVTKKMLQVFLFFYGADFFSRGLLQGQSTLVNIGNRYKEGMKTDLLCHFESKVQSWHVFYSFHFLSARPLLVSFNLFQILLYFDHSFYFQSQAFWSVRNGLLRAHQPLMLSLMMALKTLWF